MLLEKGHRGIRLVERKRRRRSQPMLGDERQTRLTIVLHSIGIPAAAKHTKPFAAQQFVLVDAVVLVPDPVRVAVALTIFYELSKRRLVDETVADEIVRLRGAPVLDAAIPDDHLVAFVLETKRESQTGVIARGKNESHAGSSFARVVPMSAP